MSRLIILGLIVHSIGLSTQLNCNEDIVKNTTFECDFKLNNTIFKLLCNSGLMNPDFKTFLFLEVERVLNEENITNFQDLLQFNSLSSSGLYRCQSSWKEFVKGNPSAVSSICTKYSECTDGILMFIDESCITNVEIYSAENSPFLKIDQFLFAIAVNINGYSYLNVSKVRLENSKLMLRKMNLMGNSIISLPDGTFSHLKNLEILDLSQNKIRWITNFTFGTIQYLKVLNLSFNSISVISENALTGLISLQEIYLNNNKLLELDDKLFSFNVNLVKVILSHNNLKLLKEQLFSNLDKLQEIACSACKLVDLREGLFQNSTNLQYIDFSINEIRYLHTNVFDKQLSLMFLNLSYNSLSQLPEIHNKTYLKFLDLARNEISVLWGNFSVEVPNLYLFNLSGNKIEVLGDKHIKSFVDLEIFDLSKNKITVVELGITLQVFIRTLRLSNNYIKTFKAGWRKFSFLEALEMEHNFVESIVLPPCIPSVKQTITFKFQHNKISHLDVTSLIEDQKRLLVDRTMAGCLFNGGSKNFVDLSYNPLNCDCSLYTFYDYLKQKKEVKLITFLNERFLTCSGPGIFENKTLVDLPSDELSCFFSKDCPSPCICGIRGKDNRTFLNCSGTGIQELPHEIPLDTTVLYFNRNNLVQMISMNNTRLNNLTELHADNNNITTLDNFQIPQNMQFLSLRSNKIRNLPQPVMDFISSQNTFQLLFGGNDQNCDCSSKNFKDFLHHHTSFIKDIENIICEIDNNGTKSLLPLYTIPDSVLCAETILMNFNPKVTIISMSVTFVILLSILLVYYKQRQLILSFLYIHCDEVFHACFEENESDDDKLFDAFIAYSSSDRHIVMDMLYELEEKEPHFQLCIHERNWLPGRFISDNIITSVQSSKRTIIILSNTFIASPWFRLELRAAIFKVSGDKNNKLIVILVDKSTSLDGIDTEIRHVISKRTYLVWGERWFWEKLRYAMPRSSCLENSEENQNVNLNKRDSEMALMEVVA